MIFWESVDGMTIIYLYLFMYLDVYGYEEHIA